MRYFVPFASPGKVTGRGLSPKVIEIEPSGFQQNVRLENLKLAPQEQNLRQPKFLIKPKSIISGRKTSGSFLTLQINGGRHEYLAESSVLCAIKELYVE